MPHGQSSAHRLWLRSFGRTRSTRLHCGHSSTGISDGWGMLSQGAERRGQPRAFEARLLAASEARAGDVTQRRVGCTVWFGMNETLSEREEPSKQRLRFARWRRLGRAKWSNSPVWPGCKSRSAARSGTRRRRGNERMSQAATGTCYPRLPRQPPARGKDAQLPNDEVRHETLRRRASSDPAERERAGAVA